MKRISLYTLQYLCGAFLLGSSCYGTPAESAPNLEERPVNKPSTEKEEEHVAVGTRRMSHAEHVIIQEERAAETQAASTEEQLSGDTIKPAVQSDIADAIASKDASVASSAIKQVKANFYYNYTTHVGVYHNPLQVGILDNTVTLEDGSIWLMSNEDAVKAWNWLTSDLVVITANQQWCSIYNYVITNQNTGASVKVNLLAGPFVYSLFRRSIVLVDYILDQVWLDDGTVWSMIDCTIMSNWAIGDTVIIGANDGIYSTSYPNILINVNVLNYGRGACLY